MSVSIGLRMIVHKRSSWFYFGFVPSANFNVCPQYRLLNNVLGWFVLLILFIPQGIILHTFANFNIMYGERVDWIEIENGTLIQSRTVLFFSWDIDYTILLILKASS